MKSNSWKLVGLIFYLLLSLFACQESEKQNQTPSKPQLPKLEMDSIIIIGQSDYFDEAYEIYSFEINTPFGATPIFFDSNLQFKHKFESDRPVIFQFSLLGRPKAIPIFAMPGDSIKMDINFVDFLNARQTQEFSGSSTIENKLLAQIKKYLVLDNNNYNYLYDMDISSFIQKIDSIENTANLLKYNAIKYEGLKNPHFIDAYNTFIKYKIGSFLKRYPAVYEQSLKLGKPVLNEDYEKRCLELFQENPEHLGINSYVDYLSRETGKNQVETFGRQNLNSSSSDLLSSAFYIIDSLFTKQEIIDHQKFMVVIRKLKSAEFKQRSEERLSKFFKPSKSTDTPQINKRNLNKEMSKNFNKNFGKAEGLDDLLEIYQKTNPPKKHMEIVREKYEKITGYDK